MREFTHILMSDEIWCMSGLLHDGRELTRRELRPDRRVVNHFGPIEIARDTRLLATTHKLRLDEIEPPRRTKSCVLHNPRKDARIAKQVICERLATVVPDIRPLNGAKHEVEIDARRATQNDEIPGSNARDGARPFVGRTLWR